MGVLGKMPAASKPPVLGVAAARTRAWLDEMIANAALMLLEGDNDEREVALARASIARFVELYAKEALHRWVDRAQELNASNEQVAFSTGLRPQTTSKRFPNRHRRVPAGGAVGYAGWRTGGGRGSTRKTANSSSIGGGTRISRTSGGSAGGPSGGRGGMEDPA